jgi:uncharacterized protein YjbI with pentapeptide repeats
VKHHLYLFMVILNIIPSTLACTTLCPEPRCNGCSKTFDQQNWSKKNLYGSDLQRASLIQVNLTDGILTNIIAPWANLTGATLINVQAQGAVLVDANLNKANLTKANFKKALLTSARLHECILEGTDFSQADLAMTKMMRTNAQSANFEHADLKESDISGSNFEKTKLRWARLRETNAQATDFMMADLRSADCQYSSFNNASFYGAQVDGANFNGSDLTGATWIDGSVCQNKSCTIKTMPTIIEEENPLQPSSAGTTTTEIIKIEISDNSDSDLGSESINIISTPENLSPTENSSQLTTPPVTQKSLTYAFDQLNLKLPTEEFEEPIIPQASPVDNQEK